MFKLAVIILSSCVFVVWAYSLIFAYNKMFDDEAAVDLGADPDDLEVLIEGNTDDPVIHETDENQDNLEDNQPNPEGTPVQPKKHVVKRPQPKLDPERLRGPRGIATLEHVFKDFKFHGKGYERHDLNRMMKQLEHWAHRLYPRFQFDDCLEKMEKLGHKKPVGTLVKRIRMDLETGEEPMLRADEDDDSAAADRIPDIGADAVESPLDAFDALLSQQLLEARARTPLPPSQLSLQQVLSVEQRERMLRNRQLAEERRLARLKAQQETADNVPSSVVEVGTEEAGQQVVSSAAVNYDNSREETPGHCAEPDVDMCGTENFNRSSVSNLEREESADGTINNKIAVDDHYGDTDDAFSQLLKDDTRILDSALSNRFESENSASTKLPEKGKNNHVDHEVVTVSGQPMEMDVDNGVIS